MIVTRLFSILAVLAVALGLNAEAAQAQGTYYREVVMDLANVITADEAAAGVTGFSPATLVAFQLACTEDSGTATLDAAIQRSVDGGATWVDIIAFTQLSATGGQTSVYADVRAASPQIIGDRLRAEYDVTGAGQYTCTVHGIAEA